MTVNNSYLLGLFGGSYDASSAAATAAAITKKAQPTAPWSKGAVVPAADALVRSALGGRKLINEDAAKLDVKGASTDYRKLFALYQGLDILNALTNRASTAGVSASEQAQLIKRFAAGLSEVSGYVGTAGIEGVRLVAGTSTSTSKTTAAVPRDSAISITGPIHEGSLDTPVRGL